MVDARAGVFSAVAGRRSDDVWIAGGDGLLHWDGRAFAVRPLRQPITGVSVVGATLWASTASGEVVHGAPDGVLSVESVTRGALKAIGGGDASDQWTVGGPTDRRIHCGRDADDGCGQILHRQNGRWQRTDEGLHAGWRAGGRPRATTCGRSP